ncbi:MAG: pilus assembly PilX N-terminal domain-containing protein [Desulfobacterales bacterium]|nr:pilus assembly PilX N-terminal domain-containing protein [Desulfobacterales bacterium]MBL7205588.1 pilus assembly PilX N-terminal domain-containing protein [Desulfobacteraceae bacterium]
MKLSSGTKLRLSRIRSVCKNENGAALVIGLMFIAILAMLGSTAVVMTTTDMQIGANYKISVQADNVAQAGTEEARARLAGSKTAANYAGDPAASPDPWWSAYILTSTSFPPSDDPNYDGNYRNYIPTAADHTSTGLAVNSLQTDISYLVKIRHKREFDAEEAGHTVATPHYYDGDGDPTTNTQASPGNIIYYGYGNPAQPTTLVQFTGGAVAGARPVEIVTAYGKSGNASKTIEIGVVRPTPPPITATVYSREDMTFNGGGAQNVFGEDNCGGTDIGPAYALQPATIVENAVPNYTGTPAAAQTGPIDIDITGYVNSTKESATITITSDQNGTSYGNASSFVTCYSDTSNPYNVNGLKLSNVTGYGLLLVEGDLTLGGGFNWNGLILVTGELTFNGGGAGINILGAVLANQTIDINGGLDIRYDSCMIEDALGGQTMKTISWSDKLS